MAKFSIGNRVYSTHNASELGTIRRVTKADKFGVFWYYVTWDMLGVKVISVPEHTLRHAA